MGQTIIKQKGLLNQNFPQNLTEVAYLQNLIASRNSSLNLQKLKSTCDIQNFMYHLSVPNSPLDMRTFEKDRNTLNLTKNNETVNQSLKNFQDEKLSLNRTYEQNSIADDNILDNQLFVKAFESRNKNRNIY